MVQITARAERQTLGDPPTVIVVSARKRAAKATFTESPWAEFSDQLPASASAVSARSSP
jgi:hypothetical protein